MVRRVVVVEDDRGLRQLLRATLVESRGWEVRFALDPREVTPELLDGVDAVLVDLDGAPVKAARLVRALAETAPGLPVVVTSLDGGRAARAVDAGAAAAVVQPFAVADLVAALETPRRVDLAAMEPATVIDLTTSEAELSV